MIDFLLRFEDGQYKDEMVSMLTNMDSSPTPRNVLETYITKDIGDIFFYQTPSLFPFDTSDLAARFMDHHISRQETRNIDVSVGSLCFVVTATLTTRRD